MEVKIKIETNSIFKIPCGNLDRGVWTRGFEQRELKTDNQRRMKAIQGRSWTITKEPRRSERIAARERLKHRAKLAPTPPSSTQSTERNKGMVRRQGGKVLAYKD
jgi:hypothetical protein